MVEVTMNGLEEMRKLIEEGDVDLLRTMVKRMAEALMDAYSAPSRTLIQWESSDGGERRASSALLCDAQALEQGDERGTSK